MQRYFVPTSAGALKKDPWSQVKWQNTWIDVLNLKGQRWKCLKKRKNVIKFYNYSLQLKAPYTIYADFESVLKKDSERETIHEICGYSLSVKSPYEEDQKYDFRGEDAGRQFISHIQSLCKELRKNIRKANAEMIYRKRK